LANTGFIAKPYLYVAGSDALRPGNRFNFPPSWHVALTTQRQIIRRHPDNGQRRSTCWLGGWCRASKGPEGRSQADQR
jgi:hypothetical protein